MSKGKTDIGHRLISNIISVLCDKRNKETNETAVSIFVFLPFFIINLNFIVGFPSFQDSDGDEWIWHISFTHISLESFALKKD